LSHLVIAQEALHHRLLPVLRGRVFHVTTPSAYRSISEQGVILAHPPGSVEQWDYDAYFRSANCVSLCDLRSLDDEQLKTALAAYYFLAPRHDSDPVFLVLGPDAEAQVITYDDAISQGARKKMIVPFIEAGFEGDLDLDLIEQVVTVEVVRPPPGPHFQALLKYGRRP